VECTAVVQSASTLKSCVVVACLLLHCECLYVLRNRCLDVTYCSIWCLKCSDGCGLTVVLQILSTTFCFQTCYQYCWDARVAQYSV
jgi:hypothetical protein